MIGTNGTPVGRIPRLTVWQHSMTLEVQSELELRCDASPGVPRAITIMSMSPLFAFFSMFPKSIWRWRALLIPVLLFTLMGAYLSRSQAELRDTMRSAFSADPRWVAIAVLFQVLALTLIALNYRGILTRLGHELEWRWMARAHLRRHAVATLVPFGSPASCVLFARDLAPKGVSGNDALSAVVLYSAGGQAAFVLFMSGTVGWLALTSNLTFSVLAVIVALPVAIAWVTLPFIALRFGIERVTRFRYIPKRVARLAERFAEHDLTPRDLVVPVLFSVAVNVTGLGMLIASLYAVGQRPSITSVLLVRLVAQIASHAIPVMQGAGVVELSMVSALQQMGVHASTAAAATVLFRAAQFWLPLALGVILFASLPRLRASLQLMPLPRFHWVRLWWSASLNRFN